MKKDKEKINENFTPIKDLVSSDKMDKIREILIIDKPQQYQEKEQNLKNNQSENYVQKFEQWPDQNAKPFEINKKDQFKETNYDYFKGLKNQQILWKKSDDFFKFVRQQKKTEQIRIFEEPVEERPKMKKKEIFKFLDDCYENLYRIRQSEIQEEIMVVDYEVIESEEQKDDKKKKDIRNVIKKSVINNIHLQLQNNRIIRWISSVIQSIIEQNIKDVESGDNLAQLIFPQEDNYPVINPQGKYYIKLKYLGFQYKIEVDDYFPIDFFQKLSILPITDKNELWPLLISKALLKFFYFKFQKIDPDMSLPNKQENNDFLYNGDVINSLTGMFTLKFDLQQDSEFSWDYLKTILEDENFFNNNFKIVLTKLADVSAKKKRSILQSKLHLTSQATSKVFMQKIKEDNNYLKFLHYILSLSNKENKDIQQGIAYSLKDYFENEEFNMLFAQEITPYELILRKKYSENLKTKTTFVPKEKIMAIKNRSKYLRSKFKKFDKKHFLNLKNPQKYKMVQINSNLYKDSELKINQRFTEKEIQIAKTCINYKLNQPPNYFTFCNSKMEEDGSVVSSTQINTTFYKNLEQHMQQYLSKKLDDFSSIKEYKQPQTRGQGGWAEYEDLQNLFTHGFVFFNPLIFKHHEYVQQKQIYGENHIDQSKELFVLYKDETIDESVPSYFYLTFQTNSTQGVSRLILQKFNFSNFQILKNYQELNNSNESLKIISDNSNKVFKFNVQSQNDYRLSIFSEKNFELMSVENYLQKVENWNMKEFQCQTKDIYQKIPNVFFKTKFKNYQKQILILNLQCEYLLKEFITVEIHEQNTHKMIHLYGYNKVVLDEGDFYLLIKSSSKLKLKPFDFQLHVFHKFQIDYEEIPLTQNLFFSDHVLINKQFEISREFLHFKKKEINFSFQFFLKNFEQEQIDPKKGKQKSVQIENFSELSLQIPLQFYLYKNDEIILEKQGFNRIQLFNIELSKEEHDKIFYTIKINKNVQSEYQQEQLNDIFWLVNINSSDTIILEENKEKELETQKMIKSWEEKQPGRKDKARKVKQYYQLKKKQKDKGLSEEEIIELKQIEDFLKNKEQIQNKKQPVKKQGKEQVEEVEINFFDEQVEDIKVDEVFNQEVLEFVQKINKPIEKVIKKIGPLNELSEQYFKDVKEKSEKQKQEREMLLEKFEQNVQQYLLKLEEENEKENKDQNLEKEILEKRELNSKIIEKSKLENQELKDFRNKFEEIDNNLDFFKQILKEENFRQKPFYSEILEHFLILKIRNFEIKELEKKASQGLESLDQKLLDIVFKEREEKGFILDEEMEKTLNEMQAKIQENPNYIQELIKQKKNSK